jgi:hypothetical protein
MQANLWRVAIAVGVMATCGVFSDLGGADASAGTLLFNISALFFQFWLTIAVLNQTGTREAQAGGIGSLFAVSLIGQLCIILGLVAFVIPGIILVVRWSISVPIALSARVPAIDALRQSWRETDGHFWPILGVLAIVYLPLLLVSVGFALTAESTSTATSVILNVALSIMLIAGWHAAVAMFLAAQIKPQSLEEVFA